MPDDAIQFRPMTPADIPAGLALCRLARWNQTQRDWRQLLTLSPPDCRVCVKDGRVVGTVTTVSYQIEFSWIGMVLVDSAERRQGIGTKLLLEALDVLKNQKLVGLDATPAGYEVYVKLGFAEQSRLRRMEAVIPCDFARAEKTAARRMTKSDWPSVRELDRAAFGADRGELLQWLFDGAPDYAWVVCDEEKLLGFSFGRHGFNFEHLGPVVAQNQETARHLATACLAPQTGKRFVLDATLYDGEWTQWLETIGFREQRPFIRMFRGEVSIQHKPELQFAILGPEFG